MSKKHQIRVNNLGRFMVYILGHRPDEFGLVPDREGFITYKELLWATHEEPGWSYVRQGHIHEVLLGKDRNLFQMEDNRIRTIERRWELDLENPADSLPKILYLAVRKRAHPHAMEKGLGSSGNKYLVLSQDRDMALRVGRRRDQKPVLLEIMALAAQEKGTSFYSFGELFLSQEIPARFISGPPVEKEAFKTPSVETKQKISMKAALDAGTFVLDADRAPDTHQKTGGRKRKGWKEEARKLRKQRRHK